MLTVYKGILVPHCKLSHLVVNFGCVLMDCSNPSGFSGKSWDICAYSRFMPNSNLKVPNTGPSTRSKGEWVAHKVSGKSKLLMSLKPGGHLMITDNNIVLESIFLLNAAIKPRACKVLQKKNTILFLYKVKNESRMFRVQFGVSQCGEIDRCKECAAALSKYVEVRYAGPECQSTEKAIPTSQTQHKEPNLSNLVETIMNDKTDELPLIYRQLHMGQTEDDGIAGLEQMVMLCFTDPSFPTFVGQVEEILENITKANVKETK